MNFDLTHKVETTYLPISSCLMPLFDAVVNAIDAVEDKGDVRGRIVISIQRGIPAGHLAFDGPTQPVIGFTVEDSGVGFDDANLRSFETAHSSHKRAQGGKGVGRFLWLKAFDDALIDSCFNQDGAFGERTFRFSLSKGLEGDREPKGTTRTETGTRVILRGFKDPWAKECPQKIATIGDRLLNHCACFFLRDTCPEILLTDASGDVFSLNERFSTEYADAAPVPFTAAGQRFEVRHLSIRGAARKHQMFFCAHTRDVEHRTLTLANLPRRLADEDGEYVLASYVFGSFLDKTVNAERTGFQMSDAAPPVEGLEGSGIPSLQEIYERGAETLKDRFADVLAIEAAKRQERLETFVQAKAPQYRVILESYADRIELPPDATDEEVEEALHRVQREAEVETETTARALLSASPDGEDYERQLEKLVSTANELGKAELVKYVAHRRLVLQFLERALEIDREKDDYRLEAAVHRLVFPLRADSDEVDFNQQNLWIVDERLAYHRYLSSDKDLKTEKSQETFRPDIAVFNRPFSFSEGDTQSSVVLIEFKRPMRTDYSDDENPIDQLNKYVRALRSNGALDHKGRPIPVTASTVFYAYLLADITKSLRTRLENDVFTPMPDGEGYFRYNNTLKLWTEVISYSKALKDAKRRNRAFFERLGLPVV